MPADSSSSQRSTNRILLTAMVLSICIHALAFTLSSAIYDSRRQAFVQDAHQAKLAVDPDKPVQVRIQPPTIPLGGDLNANNKALNQIDLPETPSPRQSDQQQAALARNTGAEPQPQPTPTPQILPDRPSDQPTPPEPQANSPPPLAVSQSESAPPLASSPPLTPPAPPQPVTPDLIPSQPESPPPPLEIASLPHAVPEQSEGPGLSPQQQMQSAQPTQQNPPPIPTGDPLPQSDSDSDPFGQSRSVIITAGKVESRFGRKIKAVRPRITIAGQYDAALMPRAAVTLRIKTDPNGNVASASIIRSSGSINIDQPVLVAMYDWWFEPLQNAQNQPLPDDFLFTITFR